MNPELSNEEIVEKWRGLMNGVIDEKRRDEIEKTCLGIEEFDDVMELGALLAGMMKNVIPQGVGRGFGFFFFWFWKKVLEMKDTRLWRCWMIFQINYNI